MAPNASDPKDLKMVLNPARRRALGSLIDDIISTMRDKLERSFESSEPRIAVSPLFVPERKPSRDSSTSPSPSDPEEAERQKRLDARLERPYSTPKLRELKKDALYHFDHWVNEVKGVLKRTCGGPEDPRADQKRREWMAARNPPPPPYSVSSSGDSKEADAAREAKQLAETQSLSLLQSLYRPIPTRLTTISKEDRVCTLSAMVLVLLSLGHYSSYSRTLLCYLTSSFALPMSVLATEETEIAQTLLLASKTLSADAETQKRKAENATSRRWKVGLAGVAGALVIGVTGGLATPIVAGAVGGIMGGVGLGGLASVLGVFFMNGALIGTLFGAYGAKMSGEMIDQYAKEVSDFKFIPVASEWGEHATKEDVDEASRRLRITVGINGWLNTKDDVVKPWRVIGKESEVFALRYEMNALLDLGNSMESMVSSYAWSYVKLEILKRTVLATLTYALWPLAILRMATSIDNPFAVARNRSEKAGEVLADAFINKAQGERPVTLIGYSLGARVIQSCLKSLAERRAFGLIENVVFIGAPVPSNSNNWRVMRSVVSGRIINVYSENDYILAFLYRATSVQFGVAGLQAIGDVDGIGNLDLSKEVSGHLRYPDLIGKILKKAGFEGILVENTDIEGDIAEIELKDADTTHENERELAEMMGVAPPSPPAYDPERNLPHQNDLLGLYDHDTIQASSGHSTAKNTSANNKDVDDLTRSLGLMDMDAPTPEPYIYNQSSASPGGTILFDHREERLRRGMHDITEQLGFVQIGDLPPSGDESGSEGGIQMQDSDSDSDHGELREVDNAPIPDEEEFIDEGKFKGVDFGEQKSLGAFPRDVGMASTLASTSRSVQ